MSVPFWLSNKNKKKVSCDTLIIGAGISGMALAYWLEKYSSKNVIIVDKGLSGHGASGRNAGFISTGSLTLFDQMIKSYEINKALDMKKFYKRNHFLIKQEFESKSKKFEYNQSGSMSLIYSQKEDHLHSTADILNKNGFNYIRKSSKDIVDTMSVHNSLGGYLDTDDAQIHPAKLLRLIESCLKNKVLTNQEVYLVGENQALTNEYDIEFSEIVFATNAYSPLLIPEIKDYIRPIRGQMLVLDKGEKVMNHNGYASKMLCYFRQLPEGEFLIGGFRKVEESTEVGFDDLTITAGVQNSFKDFINEYIPSLSKRPVLNQWAGVMGFSFDENPLVGSLGPNKYIIGGYTGHGIGKAFACAEALSKNMLNGEELPNFIDSKRIKS